MKVVIAVAVVLCLGLLGYGAWCSAESMKGVVKIHEEIQRQKEVGKAGLLLMSTITTTWKSANGTMSLTTTQNAGESNAAFAQRHKAAVLAMQAEFPIVP